VTLRLPGITTVHYLLDWATEGEFNPENRNQEWSLLDISDENVNEKSAKGTMAGLGKIISTQPVVVDGMVFKIVEDKLHETVLEGGSLHNSLLRMKESPSPGPVSSKQAFILELIRVAADSGTVTEVVHTGGKPNMKNFRPIKALPGLSVFWVSDDTIGFKCVGDSADTEITEWRGQKLQPVLNKNDFQLRRGSFIQVDCNGAEYYFRIVPKIEVPAIPVAWRRDSFLWLFLLMMLLSFGVLSYIKSLPRAEEEKPAEPLRIAKVELLEKRDVVTPPPPPPPKEEVKPEPKKEPTPEPVKPPEPPKKPMETEKSASSPKSKVVDKPKMAVPPPVKVVSNKLPPMPNTDSAPAKTEKPDVHLKSPAPEKPVGAVGLLGALKSQKGQPSQVKADQVLNDGLVSKTLSGNEPSQLVVKRNPPGVISSKNYQGSGQGGDADAGLMAASSRPGGGDSINASKIGGISGSGRNNIETSLDMAGTAGGGGLSSSGGGNGEDMDVSGGLDKESVRRTLAQHRSAIRTCYERALNLQKSIRGRIVYKWLISPNGPTVWVNLVRSEVNSAKLEACVKEAIQNITWPRAPNKKETVVNYPFQFQSKN